uniref:Poly [ADP-ribose] polymerase n=1 Tax=Oryzias latipes TaxID=8090 RepID=A0A3B3HJV2_ORYLA
MADGPPVVVEGDWDPSQQKSVKLKLQVYFQSKKKSGGGDCRVELEDDAARVYFSSGEVREEVLKRKNHEIVLEKETIKLNPNLDYFIDAEKFLSVSQDNKKLQKHGLTARLPEPAKSVRVEIPSASELDPSPAVVLENVSAGTSKDVLMMLVENISGVEEKDFSLEILWESSRAVVIFNNPTGRKVCSRPQKLQKHGLTAQPLEAAKSVRVESLPPSVGSGKSRYKCRVRLQAEPLLTRSSPSFCLFAVVQSICRTVNHMLRSIPVNVYSYYESLGSALYGKDRPTWEMPKPLTESVHPVIWKFLHMKNLLKSISDQMSPHFCSVKIDDPEAQLSPLQSFLWQKGLTATDVENWTQNAQQAFHRLMSEYSAFECVMSTKAWKVAEMDISSVTKEVAAVDFDTSREVLSVAGRADDMQKIRAPVENIVLKAMSLIERQEKGITEDMQLSPAWFFILKQEGLQKAAMDISPELLLSYNEGTEKLTMKGLFEEVLKMKSWTSEKYMKMPKKTVFIPPAILEYLKTMNPMEMSKYLFTSHGISAVYCIDTKGIVLMGTSDKVLADAEEKIKAELLVQSLHVKDKEVLKLKTWEDLNKNLLDGFNSSSKKTVTIQLDQERQLRVSVAGFMNPVKEVSSALRKFIEDNSRVNEDIRFRSSAAVGFMEKKKRWSWLSIAKENNVFVKFDSERSRMTFSGANINVQKTKTAILELVNALCTDTLTVDKPGAKKFFQSQGSMFLSTIMTELNCVVLLQSEIPEEEEEESFGEENSLCYCRVQTNSGLQLSVSRGDICSFSVDAVVNAANEDLQHFGGLALALLKAAGPQLQKLSDDYVAKNGKVRPGDAVVTDACNLSCKYVIHAVGPRFSDYDKKNSVSRLKSAVKESLREAERVNCSSIALPAISSGVFGFPVQLCADTIAQAVREFCDSPQGPRTLTEIHLVDNKEDTIKVMATAVSKEFSDLGPVMTIPQQKSNKDNLNLTQGAVSKAILRAAGDKLQTAIRAKAGVSSVPFGTVVITDGFRLNCQKVFHAVCPVWDNRHGQAEKDFVSIIKFCLEEAEKLHMASLTFPAIGTGNLGYPRALVANILRREIQSFGLKSQPHFLRRVVIVVHPSDITVVTQNIKSESVNFPDKDCKVQDLHNFCPFVVSSPSLGVYHMQLGQLTLEVSSGDITKESCDAIVNSTNSTFDLNTGVSKAILSSAGPTVQRECAQIVASPGYQPGGMIMTGAGLLPCRHIVHITIQNNVSHIKNMVFKVLKLCEKNKFTSVAFPALGTGSHPSAVANAMVDAVVDFVRKKTPQFVQRVKILIFQTEMITDFHNSMKKRQGEEVQEKSLYGKVKGQSTCLFSFWNSNQSINQLIVAEQARRTITDPYIRQLSQAHMDELNQLQRRLTVRISLERGQEEDETKIHLEGLTRDVASAEGEIRSATIERSEALKTKATLVSGLVEWQYRDQKGNMVPFDMYMNLRLEEALEKKQPVKIKINDKDFDADPEKRKAVLVNGMTNVELCCVFSEPENPLPPHWDDMKDEIMKLVPVAAGSQEHAAVMANVTPSGFSITIDRVQNSCLWQSFQLLKKQMELKNKHNNNEKVLFHGTSADSTDQINTKGFNRSYAGRNGAMFGNGSYFAVDPAYSAQNYAQPDNQGHKRMYQARVLVGDFTQGSSGMIIPPSKSGQSADLYDSVTDNINSPTMFVVFNDTQAYPEYLITFT